MKNLRILTTALPLAFLPPSALEAQLIAIRTVPVASGDQFLTAPSATLGMGGVRFAIDDSIADGWSNPAKGVFVTESSLLVSPAYYGIYATADGGGAKTFPLTGLLSGSRWFGGVSAALQKVANGLGFDESSRNLYGRGYVGRKVGRAGWSVGASVSTARLNAMDGVDLLYAGAWRIDQRGSITDVRAGAYRAGDGDRLGFTVVHNRVSMAHYVSYLRVILLRGTQDSGGVDVPSQFDETNEDRTRTWAGQVEWTRRLQAPGWTIGIALSTNYKSHPKIPNYQIQNIPRDPGTTWAHELGLGVARRRGPTTFGIDVALQPIRSHTWQEAEGPVETAGGTLQAGDKTIENHFDFANLMLRTGVSHEFDRLEIQLGVDLRSYEYRLEQQDHVEGTTRRQSENWIEWTPSAAVTFGLSDTDIQYATRVTAGTGTPGIGGGWNAADRGISVVYGGGPDFIAAPSGALWLDRAVVWTHQLWIRVPIR
ncbi:MAG: hypothetical protein OXU64_07790 [Gemmatimonadota bacterium]|nr:hypothetical protein [Gemmatimonadota bacterium]